MSQQDVKAFQNKIIPLLEDESDAAKMYREYSDEANKLGFFNISETFLQMAFEESRHYTNIDAMIKSLKLHLSMPTRSTSPDKKLEEAWEDFRHREQTVSVPMPGDVVEVTASDDILIKPGQSYGIIEGTEGIRKESYAVTFNPSPLPWWDKVSHIISSSGGPEREIHSSDLKYTGRRKDQEFQYFPGLPAAHTAKTEFHTVYVWQIDLAQQARKYRTSEKDREFREKLPELMGETNYEERAREARARGNLIEAAALESMGRTAAMLPSGDSYDQIKRRIYAVGEQLHGLVYIQVKNEYPTFDDETLQKWSRVIVLEKRDWFYMDVHNKRFEVGKRTGDTYIDAKHIGKIQQLTAENLFRAM